MSPDTSTAAEEIVSKLRGSGGRMTATRRATIDVLLAGGGHRHLVAEDIAAEVRRRLPDVAHRHLVCQHCHAAIEVPNEEFTPLFKRLRNVYDFDVADAHFALLGKCDRC